MKRKRKDNSEFEIKFFEDILKERPDFVQALKALAELYTRSGRWEEGLRTDKKLAELLLDDPIVFYNLACSHSLIGNIEDSCKAIEKALDLGYSDFRHMHEDPDLENLRKDERFKKLAIKTKAIDKKHSNLK